MRILHCFRAPVGGLFRHVQDLARAQAGLGHDVGLIVGSSVADPLTEQRLAALAPMLSLGIARLPMSRQPGLSDVGTIRAIIRHIKPLHLDVLHGHGAKGGAYVRLAARGLRRVGSASSTFYTPHGGTLNYDPGTIQNAVFMALERRLERLTTGLIFESAFAARTYTTRVGADGAPRRVVHNGLQPSDFFTPVAKPDAADFLSIGELRALKGIDVLLHALAALNATRSTPARAVIVGSGPDDATLRALARSLGLERLVTFPGAMKAADAFPLGRTLIVPSRKESLPYVVLEAAACAKPLIATNVGGIPEIMAGTDTELIPAGDRPALTQAMQRDLADPIAAQMRANRLRASVAERFSVGTMTTQVLSFYASARNEALGENRPVPIAA
jgi:glycosyltransferase involved in cell wall biosynthesis